MLPTSLGGASVAVSTLFLVAMPASAQAGSRGVLAGAPAAILVDGGLTAGADAETRVHRNGFSLAPTVPMPPTQGSADLRAILTAHSAPPGIDVDDISTGRDDLPFNPNGWLAVPPTSWGVLSFSMKAGAIGVPAIGTQPASRIAQQAAQGDVGAALFSWILPGSNVPAPLVGPGVVERSHSRAELGLPQVAPSVEIDGLDVQVLLGLDQNGLATLEPGFASLIATPESIYFTVSHATRDLVPASWWLFSGQPTLSSGATIFRARKLLGVWSQPAVFQPYTLLGLQRDEDIDGLAYDALRDKLLISMVGTARDQFLFYDLVFDSPVGPLEAKLSDGTTKVSASIGKGQNDDVDAICTLDPRFDLNGAPPSGGEDFGSSCGTPRQALLGTPAMYASAFRRHENGATFYDTWMTGWPPVTGQGPGFAAMFLSFGLGLDIFLFSPVYLRNQGNPIVGDPQSFALAIPASLALTGFDVTLRWIGADLAVTEIAEAWPVRVFL